MEGVFAVAALGLLASKLTDLTKYATHKEWDNVLTQLYHFGLGVGLIFLGAAAAPSVEIAGLTLGSMNVAQLILIGLSGASSISFAYDTKEAWASNTAALPPRTLVPRSDGPVEAVQKKLRRSRDQR